MLAAACRKRSDGRVYCVDPFDGSGDDYSRPTYNVILGRLVQSQRDCIDANIGVAGLSQWIEVRRGTSQEIARDRSSGIDLLFLAGDHSIPGVRIAYE